MTRYVALLRGVNVGGRRISMADLRAAVEGCGHTDVATYVQSGNVVLSATRRPTATLAQEIRAAIDEHAGIDPPVIVLSASQWDDVVAKNPYPDETDGTKLHAAVAQDEIAPAQREVAEGLLEAAREAGSRDELAFVGRVMYLHLPDGMGRSVLAEKLFRSTRKDHQVITARNWRTVLALQKMLQA